MEKILKAFFASILIIAEVLSATTISNASTDSNTTNISFLTDQENRYITTHKIIKMCNNPNWEPIEFAKNGDMNKMSGIAIDTLKVISKKLNVTFKNVPTKNWSQSQEFLKEKKCDILPAAIKTDARSKYALFTHPYLKYRLAIVTRTDKPFVNSIDQIKDKIISRKKGSGLISLLKKQYPNIHILQTKDYAESIQKVANGEAYASIATLPVISYNINKYSISNLHIAGYMNKTYNLSIAIRDDMPILWSILDKSLYDIDQKTQNAIYAKWTNISINENHDWRIIATITAIFLLFMSVFLYFLMRIRNFNKILEKRVKEAVEQNTYQTRQLQEQAKMAQMGEMLNMIAHQWRQPLSAISATASNIIIKGQLGKLNDDFVMEKTKNIVKYTQHLSTTIENFRNFFKESKEKKIVNTKDVIEETLNISEDMLEHKGIKLIKNINLNKEIETYGNELQQVLLNLIKNAVDALEISKPDNPWIKITSYEHNGSSVVEVADNGGGVPDEIIDKIFEPYFSTKKKKDGTGIGLYMSKTIIEEHCNGKLSVRNDKYGAIFTIKIEEQNSD